MRENHATDLGTLKQALHEFAERRRGLPAGRRAQINSEFADVFLTLLRLADRLDVDVIEAAEKLIERRAALLPAVLDDPATDSKPPRRR